MFYYFTRHLNTKKENKNRIKNIIDICVYIYVAFVHQDNLFKVFETIVNIRKTLNPITIYFEEPENN